MKQQFLALSSLLLCIFCTVETKAQQTPAFHIGVKGGTNFTKTSTASSSLEGKYGLGYQAGVMTRVDLGKLYVQVQQKEDIIHLPRRKLFKTFLERY